MKFSRIPVLLPPATDSDLDKTNDRYQHTWHAPDPGSPPAWWESPDGVALLYVAIVVITFGGSLLLFSLGWGV